MLIVETLANMRRLHTSSCCKACLHRTVHCLQVVGGIWCIVFRETHLVQYIHLQMILSLFREASADSQGQCRQQKPPCITHRLHKCGQWFSWGTLGCWFVTEGSLPHM